MSRSRARTLRARLALTACVLWLAGVEALPAVHEALHGGLAEHRHDGGSIVVTSFEDTTHRHPDGTIHFVTPKRRPARPGRTALVGASQRAATAPIAMAEARPAVSDAATHADGLAHHATAMAPAAPPITRPLPIDRRLMTAALVRAVELVTQDPLAPSARGPPVA